jgi:hypothetical protein
MDEIPAMFWGIFSIAKLNSFGKKSLGPHCNHQPCKDVGEIPVLVAGNLAMENPGCMDDVPTQTSIHKGFDVATTYYCYPRSSVSWNDATCTFIYLSINSII